MTSATLLCHPDTPCAVITDIAVEARRAPDGSLHLVYRLTGDLASLRMPDPAPPARLDGLWCHTCCEAFVMAGYGPAYREYNYSPSGAWQAYAFSAYRAGGHPAAARPPGIELCRTARTLTLSARIDAGELPEAGPARLALSVVVESQAGAIAYWALRHAPGQADFHHPDAFVLEPA